MCACIKIDQNPQEKKETKSIIILFLLQKTLQWFLKAPSSVVGSLWAQKARTSVGFTSLPLPGYQHRPPAPRLYNPDVFFPFIALNTEEESRQSQRCFCSLASLSHNASNPCGSEEMPRWSAQTQLPEDVWCQSMAWIFRACTSSIQLTKEQSSHKTFFFSQHLLWNEVFSRIKHFFHNKTFLPCLWPFPASGGKDQRLAGSRVILSAPLGFVPWKTLMCGRNTENQLSKGAQGTTAGVARAVCTRWPLHYASWTEILVRGKSVSVLVFSSVSSEALCCWRTIQRVRAAFGVQQNCRTPAISHMCVPVYTRGESGLVVSKEQPATDSERLLFYSQHSEKSG